MSETDLLSSWFETSTSFIEECIQQNGKILIHCYHGVSRSATLLTAYILKRLLNHKQEKYHILNGLSTVIDVVNFLKSRRPIVCPNDGFISQLNLWRAMKCRLDTSFQPYKLYRLDCIYHKMKITKIMPPNVKSFFQVNFENIRDL